MKKIEEKILADIEKHHMICDGDTVVVAVSGGADSMCLLHFFNKFSSKLNINVICAHVNHGIRGAEADSDEAFVREFCEKNGIKSVFAHFDVPGISESTKESLEQCGRRLRYDFFSQVCHDGKIATAHNLNDSVETFLFNFSRGTGLKGLTGIPPVRNNIIRPLSSCTRDEIEEYLNAENISFVTDSTNLSDDYSRNKIRHNIVPVLKELNNGFFSVFTNCVSTLTDTEDYLAKQTKSAFERVFFEDKFSVEGILSYDKVIQDRVIIKIAEYFGAKDVSFNHVEIIKSFLLGSGAVMLPGGVTLASDGKKLYKQEKPLPDVEIHESYNEEINSYSFPGCKLIVEFIDKEDVKHYNIEKLCSSGYADADKLKNSVFRTRRNGDRFRFSCAEHSKSLKNLFKEKNITPADRYGIPMLADENNILWINGVGVSEYASIDENTENIVRIYVSESCPD